MADYRYTELESKKVSWATKTGLTIEIKVALVQEETDYFFSGDWKPTRNGLNIRYMATIDGKGENTGNWIKKTGRIDFPYSLGRIGITEANYNAIMDAENTVKNHPAWVAKTTKEEAAYKADAEYEVHAERVNDMMTLGGKTY